MRVFGLVGSSLEHSRSKEYFSNKFIREEIRDCIYLNFPMNQLSAFRELTGQYPGLAGLNVTHPFKTEIMEYLDELDPLAAAIGAVNCISVIRHGDQVRFTGHNTDMPAFRDTFSPLIRGHHNKALVLGTGGAARAAGFALKSMNMEFKMVSRTAKAGDMTYRDIGRDLLQKYHVIINATPAGMYPDTGICPDLPYRYLSDRHLLYDLIYNPEETIFLKRGRESGAIVKNGLEMLELQAELSWKIWNRT
jgi:shikimate dehydrogenase